DLFHDYDLVLDGSDNFPTRYLVADAAEIVGIPVVWGSILGYQGQISISWASEGPRYRDLFPTPPPPGAIPSCATGGVIPSVCAVIGGLMHAEAIKLIIGHGEPLLGTLTSYDALTGRFRTLDYARNPDTPPVTELIDYEQFCGITTAPTSQPARPSASQPTTGTRAADASATASGTATAIGEAPDAIEPRELAELLRTGAPLQLIDIREPYEHAIAAIEGAELIPMGTVPSQLGRIRTDVPVVLYCHHDARSQRVLDYLRDRGYDNVTHLAGGIDRYTLDAEPALTRY
ncbi:MAG TPA: ThiF family adenylyltransferase, partial [Terrimesophilobacter sp.]|nr:ThiF family adenylyltransferase [Terrimesophilobacter sp.]